NSELAWVLAESATGPEQKLRREEAIGFYRAALALRPGSAVTYNNLGKALAEQGKPAEAEAAFRKSTALQPTFANAYAGLAGSLFYQGKPAEAEAACRKAIALQP